ncbi:MAG: ABC transporter permease [Chloroflexota bacterium]
MREYVTRRLMLFIPTIIGVSIIIFLLMRVMPGDVAMIILSGPGGEAAVNQEDLERVREMLGLNKPLWEQYLIWVWGVISFNPGKSLITDVPIVEEITNRFPLTLELAILTALVSTLIAIPIGVISAIRQDSWPDYVFRVIAIGGLAMPSFWVGTLIMLALVIFIGWMPPLGFAHLWQEPTDNLQQIMWPAIALGYFYAAGISRMTRSCALEVLRQDYIRTAWSKGLKEFTIVIRHVMKNSLLPVVTMIGLEFAYLLGGTVVQETIFSLPGVGSHLVQSIIWRDYPTVQVIIVWFAFLVLMVNLVVDISYGWLDPRVRYQ